MCHPSVLRFARTHIQGAQGKRVLEIGSYNINGSARPPIEEQKPELYIGVDLAKCDHGSGCGCVNLIIPAENLDQIFKPDLFDIVLTTEMLEHAKHWKRVLANANLLLKPDGMLVLTTRSPGFPWHEAPSDHWRFTLEDMRKIYGDKLSLLENDTDASGVLVVAGKVDQKVFVDRLQHIEVMAMKPPQ